MKNLRLFFPILLMSILLRMRRVVTSDPYGKAKISNIEDEQYFFCHKIRIICMYSSWWNIYFFHHPQAWHLIGTLCVLVSFPFIFVPCINCSMSHESAQLVYYAAFVIIFQFGWAAVQISHLAAIPDIANSQNERTGLTAIRYSMTVASNIM